LPYLDVGFTSNKKPFKLRDDFVHVFIKKMAEERVEDNSFAVGAFFINNSLVINLFD
jgi:hypothetical protein